MTAKRDVLITLRDYITEFLATGHWPSIYLQLDRLNAVIDSLDVQPASEREIKQQAVKLFSRYGASLTDIDPEFIELVRWAERRCGVEEKKRWVK